MVKFIENFLIKLLILRRFTFNIPIYTRIDKHCFVCYSCKQAKGIVIMVSEIKFCLPVGEWGFLSPYAKYPIQMNVDGELYTFPSVEHYYQAMKFYAADERFKTIINLKNPDEARLITKTPEYKINRRADFNKNKFDIMEKGMRAKFAQNPQAAQMLKATGNATLIKSCSTCYKCGFGEGSGENRMGKILMKIRQELLNM